MSDPCKSEYFSLDDGVAGMHDYIQATMPGLTTDMASIVIWAAIEDFYMLGTYRREHVFWQLDPCETVLNFDPYDRDWRVCRFMAFRGLTSVKFVPPGQVIDVTCPTPQTTRSGEALLALKPNSIDVKLPYDVMTTYWDTIVSGALYRLYMQPGKPYSDLQAARLHTSINRSGIASARADAQATHLRDAAPWMFPYFALGRPKNGGWGGRA